MEQVAYSLKKRFNLSEEIGVMELQKALPPNMLSKLLQKRQMEEVSSAGELGVLGHRYPDTR